MEAVLSKGLLAPPHAPSHVPTATPGQPFMRVGSEQQQQQQQQMSTMMPNNSLSCPPPSMGGPPSMFSHPPPVGMPLGSDSTHGVKSQAGIGDPGILPRPPLIERGPGQVRFPTPNLPRPPMNIGPGGQPHPLMGLIPPQVPRDQGPPPLQDLPPPGSQTEVWFEYKTADGRSYYSHPQTQKTTWERPNDAQIIPQPSSAPPHLPTHASAPKYPFHPPPRLSGIQSSRPPQLVPTRVWSEHKTQEGKVYFYNKVTKQSIWERPKDFELVMPLPAEFTTPPSGVTTAAVGSGQGGPIPSYQSQPVSFQSSPSTHDVPSQDSPSGPRAAELIPLAASQTDSEVDRYAIQTQPAHVESSAYSANELEQMETETSSDQNTVDAEEHMKQSQLSEGVFSSNVSGEVSSTSFAVPPSSQPPPHTQIPPMTQRPPNPHMFPIEQRPPTGHMQPPYIRPPLFGMRPSMPHFDPPMGRSFPPPQTMLRGRPPLINMPPPHIPFQSPPSGSVPILSGSVPNQAVQQKRYSEETGQEKPSETESKEELKGPRPMANVPIPGTPWSVVWTTDERQFFFNVTSRISVWTLPESLKDNPHVIKILEEPPWSRKRVGEVKFLPDSKKLRLLGGVNSDDEESEDGLDELEQRLPSASGSQEGVPVITKEMSSDFMGREQKAALAKARKSLEERQSDFKEMLLERGVSAFSTWDKELPKFVFDPRYLFLNTKERKSCFELFIRSRAEEERKEKKSKLREKIDQFKSLLVEAKLLSKPAFTFSEFASKYGKDERFKSVDKMKEREQLFTDHLTELKKLSKQKDGSQKQTAKSRAEKAKSDFMDMLGESEAITERSQWKKIKLLFDHDTRYRAVDSTAQKEEWFKEYVSNMTSQADPEQERQERIQASLKEREREVKISRSAHEKEWERERDQLKKAGTIQDYKALLVDMVRSSDSTWHDVKRILRQDHRWKMAELLDIDEKEGLFREHVSNLEEKKRLRFRKLLEETTQITLTMSWKKARKLIKEDPRYKTFGDTDLKREHEYDKFMRDAMVTTKNDFKSLLKESKLISYKSQDMIDESEKHYKDIVDVLKKDKRYLILECVAEERDHMLSDYIADLDRRGPPPPPTATHPSERLRKSTT